MKYLALATMLAATPVNAALINGVDLGNGGDVKFVSSIYFNVENNTTSQGVGDVQQILSDTNDVLWQNGDNDTSLWFVFDHITTEGITNVAGGTNAFFNTGGAVDFYTLDAGFGLSNSGDFSLEYSAISSGDLFLSGVGDAVDGFTSTVVSDSVFNVGSGQFELGIVGGAAADRIVTQSIPRSDGTYTDFTFNYSSDSLNAAGWDYVGSADVATRITSIPNVSSAALMGLGLLSLVAFRRKEV